MAGSKYSKYMKSPLPFRDYSLGDSRQDIKMDGDFTGLRVHVEF